MSQSYHVAGFDVGEYLARVLGFFGTCARMMEFSFSVIIIGLYLFTSFFVLLVKYISLVRHRDSWAFACVKKELSKLFFVNIL